MGSGGLRGAGARGQGVLALEPGLEALEQVVAELVGGQLFTIGQIAKSVFIYLGKIDAILLSYHDTAFNGIYQASIGWGRLRVPGRDAEKAKALIEEWRTARHL